MEWCLLPSPAQPQRALLSGPGAHPGVPVTIRTLQPHPSAVEKMLWDPRKPQGPSRWCFFYKERIVHAFKVWGHFEQRKCYEFMNDCNRWPACHILEISDVKYFAQKLNPHNWTQDGEETGNDGGSRNIRIYILGWRLVQQEHFVLKKHSKEWWLVFPGSPPIFVNLHISNKWNTILKTKQAICKAKTLQRY